MTSHASLQYFRPSPFRASRQEAKSAAKWTTPTPLNVPHEASGVDLCLVPEVPIVLEDEKMGCLNHLGRVLDRKFERGEQRIKN